MMNSYLYETIFDLLASQAARRPDDLAIETAGATSLTHGEVFLRTKGLMQALNSCGVSRGSRVAIILPNGAELALSMLAASSIATSVPLNPAYRGDEYRAYFGEIRVSHLLTLRDFPSAARTVAKERGIPIIELANDSSMTIAPNGGLAAVDPQHHESLHETGPARPDDIALILLTSGSTGRSKKVPLSHRNICVSVADICRTLALTPVDRCLCMWEQFHVGGLVDLLLVPLASGGAVICAGGFNAALFYDLLGKKRPTWFQGVPTTLHDLLVHAQKNDVDPRAAPFRFIRSVAASLSPQLMQDIEDLFGVPVIQTFGMTEAGPLITSNSLPPGTRRPGSVGVSCGPRIRILAPDGADLPCGATGEIVIQGENVIAGYEDAPEANATSFRNGWFHTGDTGYIDDEGFVFLTGRLKEMINRGGENITPQEIDDVLLRHPEVAQAASFSIKHRTLGEDVAAAVVLRSPNAVGESDIRGFALRHLADFKVPRMVIFLDRMPRDPIGKISRMSLAVLAEAERAANRAADSGGGLGESAAKMLSDAPTEARRRLLSEPLRRDELPVRAKYIAPVSELECRLAAIWQDILNVDMVGLLDDYFDLGGDSLMAAELFVELERNFGVRLATSDVLEHPSVAKLAALLGGETQIYANRCLIPLQTEGASPPLFFIHDMSGGVMSYRHLLRRLGTRRKVFGLQYPGQSQNSTSIMSFPEMAAVYVEAIHSVWPHGPYYVVGYSMGAQIAFETASQLTAAGGAVRLLALIDGPTRKGKVSGLQREARKLSRELFYLADVSVDRWPGYLLGLVRRDLLRHWKKWRQRRRQDAPPKFEVLIDAESARYLPPNYGGPIKVLRSTEGLEYFNRKYLGWDKYASGPIEVFDISAEHATIMTEPRVALVTAYLEDAIRQAESTGPIAQPTSGPQQSAAQRREGASGVGTWPPHPSGRKF